MARIASFSVGSKRHFFMSSDVSAKGLEDSAKNLENSTGRKCLPCAADVRDPEQVKSAVKKCIDKFGRIDFVICGAAGNLYDL